MEQRSLGQTSMAITRLGFGAWSIGGAGWSYDGGAARDATSTRALVHAVESGVNWIDTGPT